MTQTLQAAKEKYARGEEITRGEFENLSKQIKEIMSFMDEVSWKQSKSIWITPPDRLFKVGTEPLPERACIDWSCLKEGDELDHFYQDDCPYHHVLTVTEVLDKPKRRIYGVQLEGLT